MNRKRIRERYYDAFSKNLERYSPQHAGEFACPICGRLFDRSALKDEKDGLTLEHCIPGELGGNIFALTCRQCNNNQGSSLDSHLINYVRAMEFFEGANNRSMKADVLFDGIRFASNVSLSGRDPFVFETLITNKATRKENLDYFKSDIAGKEEIKTITIQFQLGYIDRRVILALIRSAYLYLFSQYGYPYLFGLQADLIRRQLLDHDAKLIPNSSIKNLSNDPRFSEGLFIRSDPQSLQFLMVPIKVIAGNIPRVFGVVLPGFTDKPESIYTLVDDESNCEQSKNTIYKHIQKTSILLDQSSSPNLLDIWQTLAVIPFM